ncbi:uncharacterized protein tasor2 [Centropristis striata]|uniref:uncharacterized protein tasor2 n=1 Tax=Centropristis striata TaxID=184440 RepID=UPI0027DEB9DD|nr:uncharacterized protein tasor2 [Centropristis striata]
MESGNGGASSKGVLVPVSESSVVFQNNILAPLKSAYLYEESKQSFRYKSAVLVQNRALEEKYYAFRTKRKEAGYSEEELEECYGFLLFDDVNKANALGETGVLTGNSTCTTLGDPSNGVYISMYSDCLDLNRWYHGKSGYIAIIRLTKGKVKKVLENYTQNFTAPTVGFDCHVSEQLPSVSAKTSSFLAFERTQYYMYELLDDGSNATTQSPNAAYPFAIVSFSYTDTKATLSAPQEKSDDKKLVRHYFPWKGQLQIGIQCYNVGVRSTSGALIPAELPPVVKIDRVISMRDLRQLLPRTVFETCISGEVFLDGLFCSLCELVSSEVEETNSLSLLLQEIKEKEIALTIQLNDGGFLILLHSSHFLTYDDTGSNTSDVLQGIFVFPVSQVIQRNTKSGQRKPAMSTEVLRVLPILSYAEGEVEKTPIDPGEELREVLVQHMQRYAALINPGLELSPSKEVSIFPDQYDVPDAHKHLYSSPEWTNRAWQSVRSYLSKPVSYQLPVCKASEILAAGQEERMEDLDDDVYICLSSPEEAPSDSVNMETEDQSTGQISPVKVETSVDNCITSAEAQVGLTALPQNVVPDELQARDVTKDTDISDLTILIKHDDIGAKNLLTPSTSDELPAELIVSITSAERTVTDASLSIISTVSATKDNEIQLSGFSTAKLQTSGVNSLNDETVTAQKVLDCPEVTHLTKRKRRKLRRGYCKVRKKVAKPCVETPSVQIPVDDENKSPKEEESSGLPQLTNPTNIDQRKGKGRRRNFRKPSSKNEMVGSVSVGLAVPEENKSDPVQQTLESTILMELEAYPQRKKTERWDLKPVISECGRILVPHGSADIADQIKSLKNKYRSTKDEQCPESILVDASVNVHDTVEMEKDSSTAPETAADETVATTSKAGENHLQNIVVSEVNPECSVLKPSDDDNGSLTSKQESNVHFSKTDGTAAPPSEAVKEKPTNTLSPGKIATKGEFLLSKLRTVLLRGKRKADLHVSEEKTADTAQDTEPCLKKGRVDSGTGMLKCNYSITSVQDPSAHVKEVSKLLSVDPLFAYALGLTPKETPNKVQKTEGQGAQQKTDSSETKEQTILDKQPTTILHRPPSIFPRRGRIKMLKKHQGISTEYVKKKWWLHFQTPACFATEKLKYKECTTRDNSVRKTEKMNSACSSTDALNLLADLALSASNDQVSPQPDAALEREPETSLKKCDLSKDVTSAEQESVLHALLRQPAARTMQPLESSSPSHLVGGSELVGLVSKEHAYSLPPSSSLLLGLPGTPFQVSPLSGSTRLLHHHNTMYGDGNQTLHPAVGLEDRREQNHRTPEYLKKHMVRRRKFRHSRTFVDKDGSIQVTKQWKENYDFNLDSRFSSDLKDRAVVRALHGPWDFSMQDTSEEVRLIVHMWIGLFYSRSTARFFHVDSYLCSEKRDSLEISSGMVSLAQSEGRSVKASSFAAYPSVTDTSDSSILIALDLSKKEESVLDQGPVILDLSLKKSNSEIATSDPQFSRKETSVSGDQKEASETLKTPKSSVRLQESSNIQCYENMVQSTEILNEVNDGRSTFENKIACASLQNAESLEHTDVSSSKGDRTTIVGQEEMESVCIPPEKYSASSGIGHVLTGCNNGKTDMKDGIENLKATEVSLSSSVTDKEVYGNKEADDVVRTVEKDETKSKDGKNWIVKVKSYKEGNVVTSPEVICTDDDSTKKVSVVVCNGSLLENEKPSSEEDSKAISTGKAENVNEDVDSCTVHNGKVTENKHHFGKEDRLDDKGGCISDVEAHRDSSDQPVYLLCEVDRLDEKDDYVSGVEAERDLSDQPVPMLCEDDRFDEKGVCISGVEADSDSSDQPIPMLCEVDRLDEKDDCISGVEADRDLSNQPVPMLCEDDRLDEKDSCISAVEADRDSSDQPVPMLCDDQDLEKKDCITESNHKPALDEQPPHADSKQDACHDLQLRKLCTNGNGLTDENAIFEKSHTSSEMELIFRKPTVEEYSENGICLADKAHDQKLVSPKSDGKNCSLDGSYADGTISQTSDSVEIESKNKVMVNFNEGSGIHEDGDAQSIGGEHKDDTTTEKELFHHPSHLPEAELALTKETDLKQIDKTNEALEKIYSGVVIPFIGIDTSGEDSVQPQDSQSQVKVQEVSLDVIPFINDTTYPETVLPTGVCTTSHMYSKKTELSVGKISLSLVSEINQPVLSGSESDDRCPTPTMDEKPYEYLASSEPSSTSASAYSGSETSKNVSDKCLGKGLEMPQKSDLEIRTLRVLQSIDKFLSKSSLTGKPTQIEKADIKRLDQTPNPSRKSLTTHLAPSHTSADFKDKKISNTTLAMVLASTSQELHRESTGPSHVLSPCKSKLDKLQETSVGQDYCHPHRSVPCSESLLAIKPKTDQDRHKTTSQTNLSHDPRSYSQRPIMAVKPSKSDENEAEGISKDRQIENAAMLYFSKNKQTKTPKVTYTTPTTPLLEKRTESFKRTSEGLTNEKESSELTSKSSWLSNLSDTKSDKAKFGQVDHLYQHQGRDDSKFNMLPSSSLPMQSFESAKGSSKLVDGNQGYMKYCLVEKVGNTTKQSIEVDQEDHSEASISRADYRDGGIIDESLFLGPDSSLMCTVYNTSQKRSCSFLEQVSQRCLQDDLTEASMEQECLIFSEQMKQLLKRTKRGSVCQQDTHDTQNMSCSSPVSVHFCSLEEEEDSVDHLNAHLDLISIVGQKIKVDMSERKDLSDTKEEEKTLQPQKLSQGTGNPMEHAGISGVTSESASLYEAMMSNVCAVKKVPSRPKHLRMDRCNPKMEPSKHFDFCDQMKKEMDESFRSNLNSVVKKSCKTKYRFYILVTSDDAFFEETKIQLEAEGHTAVQPSAFFLDEDTSSSLLIILRNEDIAEHICEVQHLLKLKNSPHVQFVGIDEPDDVVNLTHQELFTRGGFIVFDRAALEPLSLCNMKKMKEILQELSRTGKWKWMLHYRDSRRLKENARLSPEAKEKKHFLNLCQEDGILEVLPYHECDLMSREQPDYLTCLVRLQVQNISARYPVFITDTTADSAFEKNGILTMTFDSFLTYSQSEAFTA